EGIRDGGASAVLAASIFHFGQFTIAQAKQHMASFGLPVRLDPSLRVPGAEPQVFLAGIASAGTGPDS
ncbi:MAG TPA: hypothetical protein VN890_01235, partial [Methylocella sp.]|nr:hypothetical protein [Methylocella sp.]